MNDRPDTSEQEPTAPPRLVDALRSLHNRTPLVPPSVDEAILRQARAHFGKPSSPGVRPSPGAATPVGEKAPALKPARSRRASAAAAEDGRAPVTAFRLPWGVLAAAAVVVLGLGVGLLLNQRTNRPAVIAREDVDRNGKVDILDAFALARKLQQGRSAGSALDLNGDGVVDQRDVDWVASRAVKLHKG